MQYDTLSTVRERGEALLVSCVTHPPSTQNSQRALKINANTESVHGALLVLVELAEHCNRHFDSSLRDFLDVMFRHKEHKDKVVRRATLASIPRLAALAAEMFAHDYLNTYINFVFANLEKGKVRAGAVLSGTLPTQATQGEMI